MKILQLRLLYGKLLLVRGNLPPLDLVQHSVDRAGYLVDLLDAGILGDTDIWLPLLDGSHSSGKGAHGL